MTSTKRSVSLVRFLALLMVLTSSFSSLSYAGMISTESVINESQHTYDKQELLELLQTQELKAQLEEQGVSPEMVEKRVASMTPQEIDELNSQLENAPAGGIIGALVTIFIVLVVTDMLCATDVFAFVRCINK